MLEQHAWPQVYFGVAVTTLASLLLELSLTRIFSVVFYYHFAFLAISIALFGLGAGGVFSYVVAGWNETLYKKLGTLAVLNSVSVVLALQFLLTRKGDLKMWDVLPVYFVCAFPFFLSGTIVSLAIADTIERVERVYFFVPRRLLGQILGNDHRIELRHSACRQAMPYFIATQ